MKTRMYKRGEYNKPARLTKKTYICLTEQEFENMVTLSTLKEKNYSFIMREAFKLYWQEQTKLNPTIEYRQE